MIWSLLRRCPSEPASPDCGLTCRRNPASIHATFSRDHEYRRHGALSLLAGIDLLTGKVHALVEERHRSREFIELLKVLDGLSGFGHDQNYPRQSFHPYVQGNQSLVRDTAGGPLRIYIHSEAWLVAIGPSLLTAEEKTARGASQKQATARGSRGESVSADKSR
jgi:hypothetical protein